MKVGELLSEPDGPVDLLKFLEAEAYTEVEDLVNEGILPPDTFLRLNSQGENITQEVEDAPLLVRRTMLLELAQCGNAPEHLHPKTRNAIFGQPPHALITWDPEGDKETLHTFYERPFLVKPDLAQVIKERREEEGKTVREVPLDRRYKDPEVVEAAQCNRIAHGLWRILAQRIMPEWLEPDSISFYYRPHKLGNRVDLGLEPHVIDRRIVGAVALDIQHIYNIYNESLTVGVIGIGEIGKIDLRTLLADEYPDLQ